MSNVENGTKVGTSFLDKIGGKKPNLTKNTDLQKKTSIAESLQKTKEKSATSKNQDFLGKFNDSGNKIFCVYGKDRGRDAAYVVKVDPQKVVLFEASMNKMVKSSKMQSANNESINLDDFGDIIFSCYGNKIPEDVLDDLKKKHNIE